MTNAVVPFRSAAVAASDLISRVEIADLWAEPSILTGYSIGALAGHLYLAIARLDQVLDLPEPNSARLVLAPDYYGSVATREPTDRAAELHHRILHASQDAAKLGPHTLAARFGELVARLVARLEHERSERLIPVMTVREGAAPLDDYLATRVVELLVHSDDLSASAGIPFVAPKDAADVAIAALVAVVRSRNGDLAVLRGMTREERADPGALRAF